MSFLDTIWAMTVAYAPRILLAAIVLFVGFLLVNKLVVFIGARLEKSKLDPSLQPFLRTMIGVLLKVMIIISVAAIVGIETTSFVAVLGAAGLAVGLALQGSLSNFAGGVLILFFKPYRVGDLIEAQGHLGVVHEIQVFTTVLKTLDNKRIIIPNGPIANGSLVNYSAEETRRVDLTFGIGYGDDMKKARDLILGIANADERVMKDPEPFVRVGALNDSSVDFTVRLWVKSEDYWGVYFDTIEKVKASFDANGVSIPFPQMDVHLDKSA